MGALTEEYRTKVIKMRGAGICVAKISAAFGIGALLSELIFVAASGDHRWTPD